MINTVVGAVILLRVSGKKLEHNFQILQLSNQLDASGLE